MKNFLKMSILLLLTMLIVASCASNKKVVKIPIRVIESDHTDEFVISKKPMDEDTVKALITEIKSNKEGVPDTLLYKRSLTVNVKKQETKLPYDTCWTNIYPGGSETLQDVISLSVPPKRGAVTKTESKTTTGSVVSSDTTKGVPIKDSTKGKPEIINPDAPFEQRGNYTLPSDWMFGVKGGTTLSKMNIDPAAECFECNAKQAGWLSGLTPLFSIFAKYRNEGFTFMPEVMYNVYAALLPAIDYELYLHYVTLRPNFVFNMFFLDNTKTLSLQGHAAPNFGFLINNSLTHSDGDILAIGQRDVNDFDLGVNLGVGITKMFGDSYEIGLDVSYTHSFTNNNRIVEKGNNFYRFNRGLEVALTFAIPLKKSAPQFERTIIQERIDEIMITQIDTVRETIRDTIMYYDGVRVDTVWKNTTTTIRDTIRKDSICYTYGEIVYPPSDTVHIRIDTCLKPVNCIAVTELESYTAEYVCSNNYNLCLTDNYFSLDKYDVNDAMERQNPGENLEHQMVLLAKFLNKEESKNIYVQIYGHTDSAGIFPYCRDSLGNKNQICDKDNYKLSLQRANTAAELLRNYLKDKGKIAVVKGVGSAYPVYDDCFKSQIPKNRFNKEQIEEQIKLSGEEDLVPGANYFNRWVEIRFVCKKTTDDDLYLYESYPTENDVVVDKKLVRKTHNYKHNPKSTTINENKLIVPFKPAKNNSGRNRGKVNPKEIISIDNGGK